MRLLTVLSLALLLPLTRVSAQLTPFVTGSKVRVTGPVAIAGRAAGQATVSGFVMGSTRDTLLLRSLDGTTMLSVPVGDVSSVAVSLGKDRLRGSLRGTAIGAVAGALLFAVTPVECDGHGRGIDCLPNGTAPSRAQYLGTGATAGAVVGALIGAYVGVERWQRFNLAPRVHAAARPNGVGLSISY